MLKLVIDNTNPEHMVGDMVQIDWDNGHILTGVIMGKHWHGDSLRFTVVTGPNERTYCRAYDIVNNITAMMREGGEL